MNNKDQEKEQNLSLGIIFQGFEVINRCIDMNIDNVGLKNILKRDFEELTKASRELSDKYEGFIAKDPTYKNPVETFNVDADNLYNLIMSTKYFTKGWQWKKAIKAIKSIK